MEVNMKKVFGILTVLTSVILFSSFAYADNIDVKLESVVNDNNVSVQFDEVGPMTVNNSTVVPLRAFCEAAGFEVHWNDVQKTAFIVLNADSQSPVPIERYAYSMMCDADTKGLKLITKNITVSMKVSEAELSLKYNYTDTEGDVVSLGKKIATPVPATIVGGGSIVVPLRSLMEAFGLWVDWNVNAITISIPPFVSQHDDMGFVTPDSEEYTAETTETWYAVLPETNTQVIESEYSAWLERIKDTEKEAQPTVENVPATANNGVPEGAVYLGNFKITHYCSCSKCCGSYGNATAWAGSIRPGITIAVDPKVIKKLSNVYIEGYGERRAEDCGGGIKGNKIDVAVSSHAEAMKLGVVYRDVWVMP